MPRFHTIDDLDVAGKRVLLRADLNVPVKDGKVTDATRIERLAPTIEALIAARAQGRRDVAFRPPERAGPGAIAAPAGRAAEPGDRRADGAFRRDCVGPEAKKVVDALKPGEVALLENLRFHPEEEKNDPGFARQLAALGDVYVDDAFSAAHRAHASIAALAHLLPNAAGKLMQAELEALGAALEHPEHPVMALVGGVEGLDQARPVEIHHRQGRQAGDRRGDGEHVSVRARPRRSAARCARRKWPTPPATSLPPPRSAAAR